MKLTVEGFNKALKEAHKRDAQVFVIENDGEPDIVVNSASPSTMRAGNVVIKAMDAGEIEYNNLTYKNSYYSLQAFCNEINEDYGL